MNFAVRSILSLVAASLWAQGAVANYNATATSAYALQQSEKENRTWSGFLNVNRGSSLVDFQDGTRTDSVDYLTRLNAKISEDYTFRVQAGYSQDLRYPEKDDFADTSFNILRTPVPVGNTFLLGYRASATAPTSKDSHKRQGLITSLSTALNWMVNPDRIIPELEIAGAISAGRNIHEFETALDGKVNSQYSSVQSLSVGYSFKSGLSLSAEFIHKNAWSYQNVVKDSFEMSQELGFQFNPTFSAAIGHTNAGSSLRPNGNDSNVQLVDENSSIIYGSFTATF